MKKFALNTIAVLLIGGSFTLVSCGGEKTAPVDVEATNDTIKKIDSLIISDSTKVDSTVVVTDSAIVVETTTEVK